MSDIIRLKPNQYIHILDNNTNVTRLLVGPATVTRQDHEKILFQPKNYINVPPRAYCRIRNPVILDPQTKQPQVDKHGQIRLKIGDEEIRFGCVSFPLMPGEQIVEDEANNCVSKLQVVEKRCALRLQALRDFADSEGTKRQAGDEWLFEGPGTYMPKVEVKVLESIRAQVIEPNEALRLRARQTLTDSDGNVRNVGEEWLVKKPGAYLPGVQEEVVTKVKAIVLTEKLALHLEATNTFTDVFGRRRKAGQQWLLSFKDASTHIPDVYEKIIGTVPITTLNNRQYCLVLDPVNSQLVPQLGAKEIRKGECSFFLHPGERLEGGIQDVIVLAADEALLLMAVVEFTDEDVRSQPGSPLSGSGASRGLTATATAAAAAAAGAGGKVIRQPGEKWMITGPCDYVPPVQVEIVENRKAIALDKTEGVYVRDEKTGQIRSVIGQSYMLSPTEVLWEKDLPPVVEKLLQCPGGSDWAKAKDSVALQPRNRTRVVRFSVQHNAVCQIYDYKARAPRIVFGPDMVMLGPDEEFTVISLSGEKPKVPNVIKSLQLQLGPDFTTDVITVETSDHARLQLKLSYSWRFEVNRSSPESATVLFSVPDFVGDACKAVASRIRGAVAAEDFDSFHRNSARIIRAAVFGLDEHDKIRDRFVFPANGLQITNIDMQSVEPVDQKTRDSLMKSVQMAIEITTKSQEASARHEAERKEQEAKGKLDRQKIKDDAAAEGARKEYLELQAETEAIEAVGTAKAEAKAKAQASQIEYESELTQAKLKAEAVRITSQAELEQFQAKQHADLDYHREVNTLEVSKARELAEIESRSFRLAVESLGQDTLVALAQAGPELQAKMLEGLGLQGYLITDGSAPLNLFTTAKGFLGIGGNTP